MNSKYFVQFKELRSYKWNNAANKLERVAPYYIDACGSDGVFILDGRNALETMENDAIERAHKLSKVKSYDRYEIRKGTFSESELLAEGDTLLHFAR